MGEEAYLFHASNGKGLQIQNTANPSMFYYYNFIIYFYLLYIFLLVIRPQMLIHLISNLFLL